MQNSSLFLPGTDFLLLFPLALSSPPPGKKPRHPRFGAATGRPSESERKVSFWACGTGAGLVYCSEQWVSGGGGRCQDRGGRDRAGEGEREGAGARDRATARPRFIDSDRVPESCTNTPRVRGNGGAVGTPATGWQLMPFSDLKRRGPWQGRVPSSSVNPSFVAHVFTHANKTGQKQNNLLTFPGFCLTALGEAGKAVEENRG